MSSFEKFCGSELWDVNLTWDTTALPDVTPCFENIALTWVPGLYLWLCFLPYIWFLKVSLSGRTPQPASTLGVCKTIATVLLAGVHIYYLYEYFTTPTSTGADLVSVLISISSLLLAGALVQIYRRYGQFTSGVLWFYWLLSSLTSITKAYLYYKRYFLDGSHDLELSVSINTAVAVLYLTCFVLSCLTDANQDALLNYKDMSPEMTASFPSFFFFTFLNRMMSVGYEKRKAGSGIEREDLYNLAPPDTVDMFYPPFERDWNKSINRWRNRNSAALRHRQTQQVQQSNNIQEEADETTPLIVNPSKKEPKANKGGPSLVAVIMKHWLPILSLSWVCRLAWVLLTFVHPLLQKYLIEYTETQFTDSPQPLWKGIICSVLVGVVYILVGLLINVNYFVNAKSRVRIGSSLTLAIYKKALSMSGEAKEESTTGEIVNLMSVDTSRVTQMVKELYVYIVAPTQTAVAMYMLYQLLGNSIFASVAILLLATPISGLIGWAQRRIRLAIMKVKDERIKLINEALTSIKVIKLYAWEAVFEQKIAELRQKEVTKQRTINILSAIQETITYILPVLTTVVTFAIYVSLQPDHTLKPSVAFVAISLFGLLKEPLSEIPRSISFLIMCLVSVKRIVKFFKCEDLDSNNVIIDDRAEAAISLEDCSFSHLKSKPLVLHDINLTLKPGILTSLVGSVGAGKSSLLSSLIGDMYKHKGTATIKGSVALVAQIPFILNATVRNNILFGSEYDEEFYNRVIEACALTHDLEMLPKNDKTMIGEKGINLSGGQKQRISLARAVYNNADVYLLDDPLSAVDTHVGKHIFNNVIGPNGLLKNKTRLMVTHGIHWLPNVDEIYVLKDGLMSEHGTYNSLLTHNGDFAKFLKKYYLNDSGDNSESDDSDDDDETEAAEDSQLEQGEQFRQKILQRLQSATEQNKTSISSSAAADEKHDSADDDDDGEKQEEEEEDVFDEQEQVETGNVGWNVYKTYIKAMGVKYALLGLLLVIADGGIATAFNIWLSLWTADPVFSPNNNATNSTRQSAMIYYLVGQAGFGVAQTVTVLAFTITAAFCFCRASANLHKTLLSNLLKAKTAFFDVKPLGMILNRFSKDMDTVDNSLGWSVIYLTWTLTSVTASVCGVIYATPLFIFAIIPIFLVYGYIQRYYISTSRQLRRLVSKASSPIYAHFSETLAGSQTIRAYRQQDRFISENIDKVSKYNVFSYFDDIMDCWLDIRMASTAGTLVFLTALFCVLSSRIPYLDKHINASLVGLAISLSFDITDVAFGLVWTMSGMETDIVAVERIKEYSEVEREADWSSDYKPARGWPTGGMLKFLNFSTRYRPELDLVMRDLSIEIKSGEKVGIVGRTGAGKSSLTLSLFRLLEAEAGRIVIDNVDISHLGLHQLRKSLTILPQDAVLFAGSVRENLDPFNDYSDERLYTVLEQCQLKAYVMEQTEKLLYDCGEGGKNLSVGQRQLICLARALLRKTRILIMDEATAAVDLQTDDFIQKTIRSEFSDCTILTIAHRLNTVIDCDRILVMSEGRVAEFDTPEKLLANKSGIFSSMAREANLVS